MILHRNQFYLFHLIILLLVIMLNMKRIILLPWNTVSLISFSLYFNTISIVLVSKKDKSSTVELIVFLLNDRNEADELCSSMDFCFRAVYIANEQNSDISKKLSLLTVSLSSTQQLRSSFDSTTSSTPSTIRSLSLASASSARVISPDASTIVNDDLSTPRRRHRYSILLT